MRQRWLILGGAALAMTYVAVTTGLAYGRWFDSSDTGSIITASDILTGWATFPRHLAHDVIIQSWDLDDPNPTAPFAVWDALTTGVAALCNVMVVGLISTLIRRRAKVR